uniref:Complex I assembly factor TIMMDC1, mitochondrial n=1 Tax=Podarcis muralis TaxID=64176 RepID=A0A670HKX4_PODMU|nr:complex I assembly factor TIMMDC1, mitochondrial [Podarcis muralis]
MEPPLAPPQGPVRVSAASSPALAAGQPRALSRPEPPGSGSGWERVRELFRRDELNRYPEETVNIIKATFCGGIVGMVYGGVPGFINAKRRYIEQSQGEIFHNRLDAARTAHRAATRGFIRYGWRWGWRVAAFVAIFNTVSTAMSAYRDKNALSHFAIAGGCTGALFRMHLGLRGLVGGSLFGTLLGVPAGALLMSMQKFAGETLIERRKREQWELYEQKLAEWRTRLSITENISKEMDDVLQEGASPRS